MPRKEPREPPAPPGAGAIELTPALMRELFSREIPPWPASFECLWQPDPDGPVWDITGETRPRTLVGTDALGFRNEHRWIRLHVLGSADRRANDFEPYTLEFQARALPPVARAFYGDPSINMVVIGCSGDPPIVFVPIALKITHQDAPHVAGWIPSFSEGNLVPRLITLPGAEPTPDELKLVQHGTRLFGHFATTMTARGAPEGSPGPRKYPSPATFSRHLKTAIQEEALALRARGTKPFAIQDAITRTAICTRMRISAPTFRAYLGTADVDTLVETIVDELFFQGTAAQRG